jgi:adenylate kinase family enzyme
MIINKQCQLIQSRTAIMPIQFNYPIPRMIKHQMIEPTELVPNVETRMRMQRIVIVGSSGSGKSTLAQELGKKLDLPIVHLDKHYWHPGWISTPKPVWDEKVAELVKDEQWIMDGNYRCTLDVRLQAADTVVFLDLPRWVCGYRAVKRRIQYRNKPRPDMAVGCQETLFKPDFPEFLLRIWDYPNRAKPDVEKHLFELDSRKRVVRLTSRAAAHKFLEDPLMFAARTQIMPLVGNS